VIEVSSLFEEGGGGGVDPASGKED